MATATARLPAAVICIGMAGMLLHLTRASIHSPQLTVLTHLPPLGSGKTTFMQRLNAHLHAQKKPPYIINLDPAVKNVPFERNIDIRDSVDYKEVMKQYV